MDMTTLPIVSRAEFENWSDEDIVERVLPAHLVIIARSGNSASQTTKKTWKEDFKAPDQLPVASSTAWSARKSTAHLRFKQHVAIDRSSGVQQAS
jgi:hypothetical protein